MFNSIFTKTLYEKRWATLWWTLSGTALVVLTVSFFHVLQDSLGASLQDVPESMRSLLGDAGAYQTLGGYLNLQVFEQLVFLPIVLGIIVSTGLLAGDENEGTLQMLLIHPVSRAKAYVQKAGAAAVIIAAATASLLIGSWLGALVIGESAPWGGTALATLNALLVALVFSMLGYAIGATSGKRGLAGAIAGGLAFASFVISSLGEGVQALKLLQYASPFYYYNTPSPITDTAAIADSLILAIVATVLFGIGYLGFRRRDIYPH